MNTEPISDHFKFLEVIGDGKFGVVREAAYLNLPDKLVAIKTIKLSEISDPETLYAEISAL